MAARVAVGTLQRDPAGDVVEDLHGNGETARGRADRGGVSESERAEEGGVAEREGVHGEVVFLPRVRIAGHLVSPDDLTGNGLCA